VIPRLVIASHNKEKIEEIRNFLVGYVDVVQSITDYGFSQAPEETEDTFLGNARIKALEALRITGLPSLGDDSGLVVPALNGQPGVLSARWAEMPDGQRDFSQASLRIQKELADKDPKAFFVCSLCLAWPDGRRDEVEGYCHGRLTFPPRGPFIFGYDPIFVKEGQPLTFAEMDHATKNRLSHRADAFNKLALFLPRSAESTS